MNNIVFIGFRGAGKTTLATAVAAHLRRPLYSTDALVEQAAGQRIADYVQRCGWPAFRTLERQTIQSLAGTRDAVIDCGGGVVEHEDLMKLLQQLGPVVWVDAEPQTLYHRLNGDAARPLLGADDLRSDIGVHYTRRRPLYARYGNVYIDTSQTTTGECVQQILNELQTDNV